MGNSVGGRKKVKIMKINGETIKLKPPVQAGDVLKDYPSGYILLDSDSVRHYGIRASPLDPDRELKAKKLYFLVEMPDFPEENCAAAPRRVRSGIQMSAKDRLECLMLSRRSVSDLAMVRPPRAATGNGSEQAVQVKMRIPRAELEKLVGESRDEVEVARKIVDHYYIGKGVGEISTRQSLKSLQKQVSFNPMEEELGVGISSW